MASLLEGGEGPDDIQAVPLGEVSKQALVSIAPNGRLAQHRGIANLGEVPLVGDCRFHLHHQILLKLGNEGPVAKLLTEYRGEAHGYPG